MRNRIIYSDNATLIDLSTDLNNYRSGTPSFEFVAAEDKLFIGSRFPFNSFFLKAETPNTNTSAMTVKTWDGGEFRDVAELIDETLLSGASIGQSGYVTWVPDRTESWAREDTVGNGNELVTGLGDVSIYDMFWIEITFSEDLSAGTELSWIGQKFSDDDDLAVEYPDLVRSNTLNAFESGKTSYEEQHIRAASILIDDLRRKNIITDGNQILERREFTNISVAQVAKIIFSAFGSDFVDNRAYATELYNKRLNKSVYKVDLNSDARVNISEDRVKVGRISR